MQQCNKPAGAGRGSRMGRGARNASQLHPSVIHVFQVRRTPVHRPPSHVHRLSPVLRRTSHASAATRRTGALHGCAYVAMRALCTSATRCAWAAAAAPRSRADVPQSREASECRWCSLKWEGGVDQAAYNDSGHSFAQGDGARHLQVSPERDRLRCIELRRSRGMQRTCSCSDGGPAMMDVAAV